MHPGSLAPRRKGARAGDDSDFRTLLVELLLLGFSQQLLKILLPDCSQGMRSMATSLIADGQQHTPPPLYFPNRALGNAELGRIDVIVGRNHEHDLSGDRIQLG